MRSISCSKPMPVSSRLTRRVPSIRADSREVLDTGKAHVFQFTEKQVADHERIGRTDTGQHRRMAYRREDLMGHFLDDRIGVAVRHQAGE